MVFLLITDAIQVSAFAIDNGNIDGTDILLESEIEESQDGGQDENEMQPKTPAEANDQDDNIGTLDEEQDAPIKDIENLDNEDPSKEENPDDFEQKKAEDEQEEEKEEKEQEEKEQDKQIEQVGFEEKLIVEGYAITLQAADGIFPEGTTVSVETINESKAEEKKTEELIAEEIAPEAQIVKTVTFDITFYSKEGDVIEPENGSVAITVTPSLKEKEELKEIEEELGEVLECSVFHVTDDLKVSEVECQTDKDFTELTFEAEEFSSYVVTWYATPESDESQEVSAEGPKTIGGFEKVPFAFTDFNIPISWENDEGDTVLRPTELSFTIYGEDEANGIRAKICDVTVPYDKTQSTIDIADGVDIPIYVRYKTGKKESGGDASYDMKQFSYWVEFHDEHTAYTKKSDKYSSVSTSREVNDAIWYANVYKITSIRKDLAKASFQIEWYDNHNESNKRPYSAGEDFTTTGVDEIKSKIALYYATDGGEKKLVTRELMPAGEEETGPTIEKTSYSNWSISYKNLLPKDEEGNDITYFLKISEDFNRNSDGTCEYIITDTEGEYIPIDGKRQYALLGNFEGTIHWNDGALDPDLRPEDKIHFHVVDEKETTIVIPSEDIKFTSKVGNDWTFKIDNLVKYSDEGIKSYYATISDIEDYSITYSNAPKSTDVEKCHENGKVIITLVSKLDSFTIYKKWVDNKDLDARKAMIGKGVTLYLWRYPKIKIVGTNEVAGSIADGAPVNDGQGKQYSYSLKEADLGTDPDRDLTLHLNNFVGTDKLERYDSQGHEYVYYVTEIMGGDEYVTSYQNVNPYTNIETAVANGGTLVNLRKEAIRIEGIVTWNVPSVQDYTKATATIELQCYDEDADKWVSVGDPVSLAGFTAADPSRKHVFPAVDRYDEKGREIKYRVLETSVTYDGNTILVDGYDYDAVAADQKYKSSDFFMNTYDYTATAHPTWESPASAAEKYSFTVENRMAGHVELKILKVWDNIEKYSAGSGNFHDVTFKIIQKDYKGVDNIYGTVKVSGVNPKEGTPAVDEHEKFYADLRIGTDPEKKIPVSSNIDSSGKKLVWTFDQTIELPEFDAKDYAYIYSLQEEGAPATGATHKSYRYEYDGRDIKATVTNTYVDGSGGASIYFQIDKEWKDGADLSERQPVQVAIVKVNDDGTYSLADKNGNKHIYTLSTANNWHVEDYLPEDCFDKDSDERGLWTVLELSVAFKAEYEKLQGTDTSDEDLTDRAATYNTDLRTDGSIPGTTEIKGTIDAIAHNDIHRPGYEVSITATDSASACVFGAHNYKVTNKRVGEVNITFDKTWHDSENKANTRGDALVVYLYRDGERVVEAATSGEKLEYEPGGTLPLKKIYTSISAPGNQDKFEFKNLPKYDDDGVAYQYSVKEFMVRGSDEIEIHTYDTEDTTLSGYVADIEGHGASVSFNKSGTKLIRNEVYKYHNTLTGKLNREVSFYVIWHDQSSYEKGHRPDMYYTLYYRPLGYTENPVKYEGDYKVLWEAIEDVEGNADTLNPYHKVAKFTGLPVADEEGNVYEYFAAPSLNNPEEHYDERHFNRHSDASKSSNKANKSGTINHWDINKDGSDECGAGGSKIIVLDGGNIRLLPEGGVVEYIIDEKITPKGKKTWKNVEQGLTAVDLPYVEVYLGRTSDHDKAKDLYESGTLNLDNSLDKTPLDQAKLSFDFGTNDDGTKKTIPEGFDGIYDKYDYYGQIYTYQLAEKIYVNSSVTPKIEIPAYIMSYDKNSMNLENTYMPDGASSKSSRKITVSKKWDGIEATKFSKADEYPEARFTLYRMEIDPVNCEDAGSKNIPYNPKDYTQLSELPSKAKVCGDVNGEERRLSYNGSTTPSSASWENLPIYAPSGRPYMYFVEETGAHGMDSYTIENDAIATADGRDTNNKKISDNVVLITNNGLSPEGNASVNEKTVTFTNTLKSGDTFSKITGTKKWSDGTYKDEVRPTVEDCNTKGTSDADCTSEPVRLKLTRTASAQSGVGNKITKTFEEGKDYTVSWNDNGNDTWTYTISPTGTDTGEFQIYAPNGQPYTYTVTETLTGTAAENYKAATASASRRTTDLGAIVEGALVEKTVLVNQLKGQIQLFKKWDDALNEFELRSDYVHVILQYRQVDSGAAEGADGATSWETYKEGEENKDFVLEPKNKWKVTVSGLPVKNADGSKVYEYRLLETKFTDHTKATLMPLEEVTIENVPKGTSSVPAYNNSTKHPGHYETKVGSYIVYHSEITNLTTNNSQKMLQVENFLSEKTKLTVQKQWEDIKGNDDYNVLPNQVTFKIQYKGKDESDSAWRDLYKQGTTNLVKISALKQNDWKVEVDNLPLNTDGNVTIYRAIELGTNELGTNLGRFQGYNGESVAVTERPTETSGTGVYHNHHSVYYSPESGQENGTTDCSTIATNWLATRPLTIRKKWNDEASHGDVTIELWSANYKTGSDGAETLSPVPGTAATLKASEGYEYSYTHLPAKNESGIDIVYYVKEVTVDGAPYDASKYDTAYFVSKNSSTYQKISALSGKPDMASIDGAGTVTDVCIVNTPKASLQVTKLWNDENDRHKYRTNVTLNLTDDNGGKWSAITVGATHNKAYTFTKLPIYKAPDADFVTSANSHMEKVTYTVVENNKNVASKGYKAPVYSVDGGLGTTGSATISLDRTITATTNNIKILNELNPPKVTITADKVWNDENNRHGSRPEQVSLSLYYRYGTDKTWRLISTKALGEDGNYPDGNVYTTSQVTQTLSHSQASGSDSNKWLHTDVYATWENLPTVYNKQPIYYKVLETNDTPAASYSNSYTGNFNGYQVTYSDTNGSTLTTNGEMKTQTITNTLARTEILVEKHWEDSAEQNIRPYSVTFELQYNHANKEWRTYTEGGKPKYIVVTGDHSAKTWSGTVSDLPFMDAAGHEYIYRLKEVSMQVETASGKVDVVDSTADDEFSGTTWRGEIGTFKNEVIVEKVSGKSYNYKVTATNTPEVGNITVTKVWEDDNNRDGFRPKDIEVTLYRDGKVYDSVEIGFKEDGTCLTGTTFSGNKWTYTWTNLPKYKDDATVHDVTHQSEYYVVEESMEDYDAAKYGLFEDMTSNTHPDHIQSHVAADTDTDLWIKNTHKPIRFKIDAYKKWDDNKGTEESPVHDYRPTAIGLKLQWRISGKTEWKNFIAPTVGQLDTTGTLVETTDLIEQTVNTCLGSHENIWIRDDNKPASWDNLPAYVLDDGESKHVEYRIVEVWNSEDSEKKKHYESELPHFHYDYEEAKAATVARKSYPESPLIVENIADYNSTLTVMKNWGDQELLEKYGAMPKELHVHLQKWDTDTSKWVDVYKAVGGSKVLMAAILKENESDSFENSWTHTFENLTATEKYRVVEDKIVFADGSVNSTGYTEDDPDDMGDGDIDGINVGSNTPTATIGNFKIKVEKFDELKNAGLDELGGESGTSKHWVEMYSNKVENRTLEVTKTWNDENDRDKTRPTHIYVTLFKDNQKIETVMLSPANGWKHSWEYLPLYKNGSLEFADYRLIETDALGKPVATVYKTEYFIRKTGGTTTDITGSISDDGVTVKAGQFTLKDVAGGEKAEVTVKNTYKPVKTTLTATKTWQDENNRYKNRPTEIYLALFYKYQHEGDDQWRLVGKKAFVDGLGQYDDALIHTTSDSIQKITGDAIKDSWGTAVWENLPSQAVVDSVVRIPLYRVVEVSPSMVSSLSSADKLLSTIGDETKQLNGYVTELPESCLVHGGLSENHVVVNKTDQVQLAITKHWEDQHNRFADRPLEVQVAIQQKKGEEPWTILKEWVDGSQKDKIVTLTKDSVGESTDDWTLLVEGLPSHASDGNVYSYRAIEIALIYDHKPVCVYDKGIIADPITAISFAEKTAYKTEETVNHETVDGITQYQTRITNTADKSAKLTVSKRWDDYNNARNTRPLSLVFVIEKRKVHEGISSILENIVDFFKENHGWEKLSVINEEGDRVDATVVLEGPDFEAVTVKGLPLYDIDGKELVYRAREIKLIYENSTVEVASGAGSYKTPEYLDAADIISLDSDGITHVYATRATNQIRPDPEQPKGGGSKPKKPDVSPSPAPPEDPYISPDDPYIPPEEPYTSPVPVITKEDPEKPELPPELEKTEKEIEEIKEPEDIIPIVDKLIDLPDSPERDYVVKKLWEEFKKMVDEDPNFYDHFDPEMQEILKRFYETGVLGRRRRLPKTGGLIGSSITVLMGLGMIGTGIYLKSSKRNKRRRKRGKKKA